MVVYHFSLKGAAGNFHTQLSLNRTRHRLCPRSLTGVLGIGVTEIILSTLLQSQFAFRVRRVSFSVLPSVALAVGSAVVGADRVAVLHDEFAGAEHHVLVRHGEFHGLIVAAVVAAGVGALVDGVAVQAEDFGVGSDGHFLRRGCGQLDHNNVGGPIRRHIVDFLDLGIGVGRIPGDVVDTCVAVEYAANDLFAAAVYHRTLKGAAADHCAVAVCHTARALEGSTKDCCSVVVCHRTLKFAAVDRYAVAGACHTVLEGSANDRSVANVCHGSIEDTVALDVAEVCHFSRKGSVASDSAAVCHRTLKFAAADGAFVCHTARALECATVYIAAVCHRTLKFAASDGVAVFHTARALECATVYIAAVCHRTLKFAAADGAFVCHAARKGAVLDGVAVFHFSIEDAVRDCSAGAVPFSVVHCCIEGAAGNCRIQLNLNRTSHSRSGLRFCTGVLGMGGTEIIRSIIQIQCVVPVPPAVATGADRVAVLHYEFAGGAFCKGPQGEHGEHHAQCQDQAENAFFHRGRPPFLPRAATKAARSFISGFIIP